MSRARQPLFRNRAVSRTIEATRARTSQRAVLIRKASPATGSRQRMPFVPPEDWYEPADDRLGDYRFVVQEPGEEYQHVLTPQQIRERLAEFPSHMIEPLEVVQLSRMTRKKKTFPCYGMQWGNSLYLYPIETTLIEHFSRPPLPAQYREACMYGGRWQEDEDGGWKLLWTEATIRDYYLNNILIHELGHLLDERNRSYLDRERFADWFAIEYGYKSPRRQLEIPAAPKPVRRRHHAK